MCNFNCFSCTYSDCICKAAPTIEECKMIDDIDSDIDYENRKDRSRLNGTIKFFKYNNSEKGKATAERYKKTDKNKAKLDKYNHSEKGKARLQKYYNSEKGRENEKRKAERKRMKRLQQKGTTA